MPKKGVYYTEFLLKGDLNSLKGPQPSLTHIVDENLNKNLVVISYKWSRQSYMYIKVTGQISGIYFYSLNEMYSKLKRQSSKQYLPAY